MIRGRRANFEVGDLENPHSQPAGTNFAEEKGSAHPNVSTGNPPVSTTTHAFLSPSPPRGRGGCPPLHQSSPKICRVEESNPHLPDVVAASRDTLLDRRNGSQTGNSDPENGGNPQATTAPVGTSESIRRFPPPTAPASSSSASTANILRNHSNASIRTWRSQAASNSNGNPNGHLAEGHYWWFCGRRPTLPLCVCFLVPTVVLSLVFFILVWFTFTRTMTVFLDRQRRDIQVMVQQNLPLHIQNIVAEMVQTVQLWSATSDLWSAISPATNGSSARFGNLIVSQIQQQLSATELVATLVGRGKAHSVMLATPDGKFFLRQQFRTGRVVYGEKLADGTPLTVWNTQPSTGLTTNQAFLVKDYDPRLTAWFVGATSRGTPALSRSQPITASSAVGSVASAWLAEDQMVVSLPVFNANRTDGTPGGGSLVGVIGVAYSIETFQEPLSIMFQTLRSSGMLALLDCFPVNFTALNNQSPNQEGSGVMTTISSSPETLAADLFTALSPESQLSSDSTRDFDKFGPSLVMEFTFCPTSILSAGGSCPFLLPWKLEVVVPISCYSSGFDTAKWTLVVYAAVYLVILLIVKTLKSTLLILRPLRIFTMELQALRQAVLQEEPVARLLSKPSFFTELRRLHFAVVEVIDAIDRESQHRAEVASALERQRAEEEAAHVMQAKESFFAMVSHEMRTPLTAVIGMAEILLETTQLDGKQRECAELISSNGTMLLALVNDLLDYKKLEADKLELEMLTFNLRECIERAARVVQIKAEDKNLELIVCIHADVPTLFTGDSSRLSQVLLNLLSNAIKFTHEGMVILKCFQVDDSTSSSNVEDSSSGSHKRIQFEVKDTGIGISEEAKQRLFQPFVQADASMSRRYGGTGLGLVISKRLVELMGGHLEVFSAGENQGAVFRFSLALPSPGQMATSASTMTISEALAQSCGNETPQPVSALILDPLPERREATAELLTALGLPWHAIATVKELAEAPQPSPLTQTSLVVANHADALEVANTSERDDEALVTPLRLMKYALREAQGLPPRKIVLAVSVSGSHQCLPDVVCLTKPMTMMKLSSAILSAFNVGMPAPAASAGSMAWSKSTLNVSTEPTSSHSSSSSGLAAHQGSGDSPRILVVDDVAVNQRVLTLKLQQRGYTHIDLASNGNEAVEITRRNPLIYNCILMDAMMPGMDGYTATRHIKEDPRYANVPIIGVTGNITPNDIRRCLDAGMTDVLGKPIDSDRLFNLLEKHLNNPAAPQG